MQSTKLSLNDVATSERQYLETIFSLGDGYVGVRDAVPFTGNQQGNLPVMLINGFYATNPIVYGESAYGYAKAHQTIISLPSPKYFDLETKNADSGVLGHWQIELADSKLDFTNGCLHESFQLVTQADEHFELTISSQMIQDGTHQFVVSYMLKSLNYEGTLTYRRPLLLSTKQASIDEADDPRVAQRESQLRVERQPNSDSKLMQWSSTSLSTQQTIIQSDYVNEYPKGFSIQQDESGFLGKGAIKPDETVTWQFVRQVSEINQPLVISKQQDYDQINHRILAEFWRRSQVEISDAKLQKGIQYNLFQLFQSAGRNGVSNIAAKGITGPGYEGHYFWDTEMYILPFFIYTNPQIAKQLLSYRHSILNQARARARELGVSKGALFAWRTINGEEASAYFPAGTAQYHINADIAHAVKLYFDVTNDQAFLKQQGAEIVLETARFWLSYGSWHESNGQREFCLYKVTGPDEYTALVNNNYYTNRMAKENLAFAAWLIQHGYIQDADKECKQFKSASEQMYLPYDQDQKITKQDDESPAMPIWPFETMTKDQYPLLLHYHPLTIYRYRVNKQADTLLAEMLFPEDQVNNQLKRDFDYYEAITTHDSSLSRSIFSILASRLDRPQKAFNYYMDTALMDLVDLQGNAKDGLHEANLGGSWLGLTYGFAGVQVRTAGLCLTNHLPSTIKRLSFRLSFRNRILEIILTQDELNVVLIAGEALTVTINGRTQTMYYENEEE